MKKFYFKIIAALCCAIFSSCQTVEDAREAQKETSLVLGERTASPEEFGIKKGGCYDLAYLEKVAVEANPLVFQARQYLIWQQLELKNVKAGYLPTIDAYAGFEESTHNEFKRGQSANMRGNGYGGIDFQLLIYDFGKTDAKVVQQMQNVVSAEKNLILAEIDAVYKLRQAFFGLKRCIELNIVAEQAVAQYKEHLDHMLAKYKYGKSTKYDCSKARVDYDSSVLEQITTSNNVRIAKANLINGLGFDKDVDFSIGDGIMKDADMTVEELMELVRKYDPSLGMLYASAKGASSYIDEQIANLYPTISLNAEAVASGVSSGWPAIWNIAGGAEMVQNIFNGNRNMNAIEQAVSELRSARSQISEYEQKAYAELTTAHLNLEKSKKQYEVALAAEKVAKENLDLVTERFNVGKVSALERTDAQVSYTSAQADAVSAKYDWQDALATIAYLTGGDVKSEN